MNKNQWPLSIRLCKPLISDGSGVGNSSAWAFCGVIPFSSWDSEYGNFMRFFFVFARTRRPSSVTSMITLSPRPKRDILLTGLVIRIPRLLPQGWIVLSNRAFAIVIITPLSLCSYVKSIYQVVTMPSPNKHTPVYGDWRRRDWNLKSFS